MLYLAHLVSSAIWCIELWLEDIFSSVMFTLFSFAGVFLRCLQPATVIQFVIADVSHVVICVPISPCRVLELAVHCIFLVDITWPILAYTEYGAHIRTRRRVSISIGMDLVLCHAYEIMIFSDVTSVCVYVCVCVRYRVCMYFKYLYLCLCVSSWTSCLLTLRCLTHFYRVLSIRHFFVWPDSWIHHGLSFGHCWPRTSQSLQGNYFFNLWVPWHVMGRKKVLLYEEWRVPFCVLWHVMGRKKVLVCEEWRVPFCVLCSTACL